MFWKKKVKSNTTIRPIEGAYTNHDFFDRYNADIFGELTPQTIGEIITNANNGDTVELCKLAKIIEDKNWDILHSMETRHNALLGCKWSIESKDEAIGKHLETVLLECGLLNEHDTFYDLLSTLMGAVISPFVASEIIWEKGSIIGFEAIESRHFTFYNSFEPKLITNNSPMGESLPPNKFVIHSRKRGGLDITKCGLVRTLAWLHVFQNYPMKDWLSFVERFGMPFISAKVDQNTWENERAAVHAVVRSFGPSGGGVFNRNTEIELLQCANNGGDIYKQLMQYTGDAITKVLLGQTASSGDSGGLSGGDAQSKVRQDILESDARAIESEILRSVIAPWVYFNYGANAPLPKLVLDTSEPEDQKALAEKSLLEAQKIQILCNAGYTISAEEVSKLCGVTLSDKSDQSDKSDSLSLSAQSDDLEKAFALMLAEAIEKEYKRGLNGNSRV